MDETPIAQFSVQKNYDDFRRYQWRYVLHQRKVLQVVIAVAPVFVLLYVFVSPHLLYLAALAVGAAIGAILRILMIVFTPKRKCESSGFLTPMDYVFYTTHLETHIHEPDSEGQITSQYSRYVHIEETQAYFYLKRPDKFYVQLPKHCMTSEQITALRELFARTHGGKFKQYHPKGMR